MYTVSAIVPGCFDPFHLGHVELVRMVSRLFSSVTVAVADDTLRQYFLLTAETRKRLVELSLREAGLTNVQVTMLSEPLADFIRNYKNPVVVRGAADISSEMRRANMNHALNSNFCTVIIPCYSYVYVSATLVRELVQVKAKVEYLQKFVSQTVAQELVKYTS